ncbi:MAG: hypothetical protein NC395_07435 [Prevotella sp.]|nr:hypothetical protein [Prevotella sp.]
MNMKKTAPVTMLLAAAVMLAGCTENNGSAEGNASADTVSQTEYVMRDGDVLITGEVTQIVGNEVTLALGDVSESGPSRGENGNEPHEMPNGENFPKMGGDGEMPQMPDGVDFSQMGENGEMPQMPNGVDFPQMGGDGEDFSRRNGGGRDGQGRGKGSSVSIEKSGETNSYIIPVGMTVKGASGRNTDYSAVSAGMALQLTLNSEGYVVAAEIL